MDNQRRDRNRYGGNRSNQDDTTPRKPEPRRDPGAYIGRMPERQPEGHRDDANATDAVVKEAGQSR